jgi:prevent-host-death family protein
MLEVNIEKIIPITEARDSLNNIVDIVESSDELYVITKNGKPAAIVVGVHHLEKLTGIDHKDIMPDEIAPSLGGSAASMAAASSNDDQSDTTAAPSTQSKSTDGSALDIPVASTNVDDVFAPDSTATETQAGNMAQPFSVPDTSSLSDSSVLDSISSGTPQFTPETGSVMPTSAPTPATQPGLSTPVQENAALATPLAQPSSTADVDDIFAEDETPAANSLNTQTPAPANPLPSSGSQNNIGQL